MQIKLPDFLIAELFKDSLIITKEKLPARLAYEDNNNGKTNPEQAATRETTKWFLGNNKKNITIIVNDVKGQFISDEPLQLLTTILGACNLDLNDVAILNLSNKNLTYSEIKETFEPQYIILFNVTAAQIHLPFSIPNYQIQQYDSCAFLFAPSLTTMLTENDTAKKEKRKLWNSLKNIFNV